MRFVDEEDVEEDDDDEGADVSGAAAAGSLEEDEGAEASFSTRVSLAECLRTFTATASYLCLKYKNKNLLGEFAKLLPSPGAELLS